MKEYFDPQIENAKQQSKTDFKLFYIIQGVDVPNGIVLEMKSINPPELDSFDFSNLEFVRTNTNLLIPTFKYKNT